MTEKICHTIFPTGAFLDRPHFGQKATPSAMKARQVGDLHHVPVSMPLSQFPPRVNVERTVVDPLAEMLTWRTVPAASSKTSTGPKRGSK